MSKLLHADQLQIFAQVTLEQLYKGLGAITAAAEQILRWANTNSPKLNANKTKAIIFGSSHAVKQTKSLNLPGVLIVGEVIPSLDEGVVIVG